MNETTLSEVRALLGTPTLMAKAEDGNTVVGYGLAGNNYWSGFGRSLGKGALTLGLGANSYEYTVKAVLFKFDADNKVIDYKKGGASYITKHRFTYWNECERKLTQEEINSPTNYPIEEVCKVYAQEVAAKKGIRVDEVDIDEEFEWCNIPCQTTRSAIEAFGKLTDATNSVDEIEGDGSKGKLIFD
ncbi:MAG: hypothetical protein Q4E62_00780 [Sutterellaceae bacterium]|nr:hypothetical protein [Sutterellaceae bacterium]